MESAVPGWRRSSRCDNGQCVEIGWLAGGVAVRDNTRPDTHLVFDQASWQTLLRDLRGGLER